ncbi:MAG: putative sugar nucleotidyl transferase [candidate division WOR-3 bacterium]|nr:putative sugar nucleotidyl transferase [candidate division WOR-3 bacterium]
MKLMSLKVYIYEDDEWRNFLPLTHLHPVFDLVCGMWSGIKRMEKLYDEVIPISRFHSNKCGKGLYINGRAIFYTKIPVDGKEEIFKNNNEIIAYRSKDGRLPQNAKTSEVKATLSKYPWDLIGANKDIIERDFEFANFLNKSNKSVIIDGNTKLCYVENSAKIYNGVYFNTENGPIYIGKHAQIRPPTVVYGPAYIGERAIIDGAKVREGCHIGRGCRIGGEVEESIFLAFSNKHHEGFVGHSYIGEWVNLGALTSTSDLKNTYGNVRISLPSYSMDTGILKLGSIVGDHTKTGIGTLLTTGCIIGIFCNLYGGGTFDKYIESFSWGTSQKLTLHKIDKAIETAKKVMQRRGITATEEYIERIVTIFNNIRKSIPGQSI